MYVFFYLFKVGRTNGEKGLNREKRDLNTNKKFFNTEKLFFRIRIGSKNSFGVFPHIYFSKISQHRKKGTHHRIKKKLTRTKIFKKNYC